ncbi:MAG TPA: hypothetical protein VGG14_07715 [Candidatus Sulfotelmatobacter sp.]
MLTKNAPAPLHPAANIVVRLAKLRRVRQTRPADADMPSVPAHRPQHEPAKRLDNFNAARVIEEAQAQSN